MVKRRVDQYRNRRGRHPIREAPVRRHRLQVTNQEWYRKASGAKIRAGSMSPIIPLACVPRSLMPARSTSIKTPRCACRHHRIHAGWRNFCRSSRSENPARRSSSAATAHHRSAGSGRRRNSHAASDQPLLPIAHMALKQAGSRYDSDGMTRAGSYGRRRRRLCSHVDAA